MLNLATERQVVELVVLTLVSNQNAAGILLQVVAAQWVDPDL